MSRGLTETRDPRVAVGQSQHCLSDARLLLGAGESGYRGCVKERGPRGASQPLRSNTHLKRNFAGSRCGISLPPPPGKPSLPAQPAPAAPSLPALCAPEPWWRGEHQACHPQRRAEANGTSSAISPLAAALGPPGRAPGADKTGKLGLGQGRPEAAPAPHLSDPVPVLATSTPEMAEQRGLSSRHTPLLPPSPWASPRLEGSFRYWLLTSPPYLRRQGLQDQAQAFQTDGRVSSGEAQGEDCLLLAGPSVEAPPPPSL